MSDMTESEAKEINEKHELANCRCYSFGHTTQLQCAKARGVLRGIAIARGEAEPLVETLKNLREYPHCIKCCKEIDETLAKYRERKCT